MKTKLLFAFLLITSFLEPVASQEYHAFLNNSSWIVNDMVSCCRAPYVRMINEGVDVVIGDYTYKRFNDPFPSYNEATEASIDSISIREDLAAKKVYKIVNGTDVLLYDFSMQNGDTISQFGFTWVATVDNCGVNQSNRRRITLQTIELVSNHNLTQVWIEGVGTVAHPFYPERNMYSVLSSGGGLTYHTKCSFQDGEHIYGNPNCESLLQTLGTADVDLPVQNMVFSPNPFLNELTVTNVSDFANATLKLFNTQGQLVKEIRGSNSKTITVNRENLSSGLYLAQVSEDGKIIKTQKVILR